MNKDIAIGNKIIYQKMHRKERMRHLQKLQEIKSKPSALLPHEPSFKPHPHPNDSEKNLQVQRNNIALFNKIAFILNDKPKIQFPKSRTFVKSVDQALFSHEKRMLQLKSKNENFLKRLSKLQPTISNHLFQKDRSRNERYLSFMGKYPFRPSRRTQTDFAVSQDLLQLPEQPPRQQVFHEQSLDFDIAIKHTSESDQYVFTVKDLLDGRVFVLKMGSEQFREELMRSGMSYEKMVGRLRMERNGSMNFIDSSARARDK